MAVVAGIPIHEAAWTGNVDRIKELSLEASSLIKCVHSFVRKNPVHPCVQFIR